jgi:hypothetical protein
MKTQDIYFDRPIKKLSKNFREFRPSMGAWQTNARKTKNDYQNVYLLLVTLSLTSNSKIAKFFLGIIP